LDENVENFPIGIFYLIFALSHHNFPIGKFIMTATQIGELIRNTRKAQGLTQPQLAAASGVGLRFLVELEAGKGSSQLAKALAVLEALGCKLHITTPERDQR
jgi:y4mF family transcriptional regulator